MILPLHPACSPVATLKLDPAPAMQSLYQSQALQEFNIQIELGEPKNKNKLATIDKQIQELENEFTRIVTANSQLRRSDLSCAISSLNSRIRTCGLSSYEQWHRRSQFSLDEINAADKHFINLQHSSRMKSHDRNPSVISTTSFKIGSIVYITDEKSKHSIRPRYIVDSLDGAWLFIRKLTENQLRAKVYKIHKNRCVKVSTSVIPVTNPSFSESSDDDYEFQPERFPPLLTEDPTRSPTTSSPYQSAPRKSARPRKPPERLGVGIDDNDDSFVERSPVPSSEDDSDISTYDTHNDNPLADTNSMPTNEITLNPQPSLGKSTRPRKPPDRLGMGSEE